jgi:glycosyltransferase involved in cell wall biosynthesis
LKTKIAFIVQRYGLEVNGGAEYHCRILAERLANNFDVTILTTCAKDYITWANSYPDGETLINNIKVLRFPVEHTRQEKEFRSLSRKLKQRKPYQKALRFLGLLKTFNDYFYTKQEIQDNLNWVKYQGPYVPKLIHHLQTSHTKYDVLIFFTYLYYPTIEGLKIAPEKSVLIPTAHDEPPIYFSIFKQVFNTPKYILYNTLSEKNFVEKLFKNEFIESSVIGLGIDEPKIVHSNTNAIIPKDQKYIIYIGRIDASKGCKILYNYFVKYKNENNSSLKLVMVGELFMKMADHPDIIKTGFIKEDLKIALLRGAESLVIPSFYESLSLVTLESMAYGVPVIANSQCEVLKDHIQDSKAGFLFSNYESFKQILNHIPFENFNTLSQNAKVYVTKNYAWNTILTKFNSAVSYIIASKTP